MTLPAGITTATVTYGKRMGVLGTEATLEATVQADRPLVWSATGDVIDGFPDPTVSTAGGFLSFQFPHTNQPGFIDGAGNQVTGWAGVLIVKVRYNGQVTDTITRAFQVPSGQSTVDLDLVPEGSISPAVTAPSASVTSFAGRTGAVTAAQAASDLNGFFLRRWTANTAYLAGDLVLNPTGQIVSRKADGSSGSTYDSTMWTIVTGGAGGGSSLTRTAVKNANYTAAAGDLVPADASSGSFAITLPTAPADKAQVAVKVIQLTAPNTVTVTLGGTDTFNRVGGVNSVSFTALAQGATFQYDAASKVWTVAEYAIPLTSLQTLNDARYLAPLGILAQMPEWDFGHSYLAGSGAGSFAIPLTARNFMASRTTRAVAGSNAGATGDQLRNLGLAENGAADASLMGLQVVMSLINDTNSNVAVATVVEAYRSIFAYLWGLRLGITSSAFSFGSGWTTGTTSTTGSYVDFSWVGDTAYVSVGFTTAAATVSVKNSGVGGGTAQTVSTGGFAYAFPGVIKLSGYGPGNHTVRLTLESGAGLTVYRGLFANSSAGTVAWCAEGALTSYNNTQNTLMTSTYRDAVTALAADFPNVVPIATDAAWDPATMLVADGVHLNTKGVNYWVARIENALRNLPYRQGQNTVISKTAPAYNQPLPSAAASYVTTTIDKTKTYTTLKTWASDNSYIYSSDAANDLPLLPVGASIVVTGGTGWTVGNYQITSVSAAFGTPDGTRNMYQVQKTPGPLGNENTVRAAAAGTGGGTGRVSL